MKLAGKNKAQLMVFGAVIALAVIYAAIAYGVMPLKKQKKDAQDEIVTLKETLDGANATIRKASGLDEKNEEIKEWLREFDAAYILQAEFGNYLLGAQTYIEQAAQKAGIRLDQIQEAGTQPMTMMPGGKATLTAFTVSVSATCSYQQAIDLLERIYSGNPYISVSSLKIASGAGDDKHSVSFRVYFPIWARAGILDTLKESENRKNPDSVKTDAGGAE